VAAAFCAHHAQAPHAQPCQPGELGSARVVGHQRDAAKPVRMALERVGEELGVAAISAGTDDDGAAQAKSVCSAMNVAGNASRDV
jgi:hypothetical protein